MSMYADYTKERKGHSVLEFDFGFVEYSIREPFLRIEELYVKPEFRGLKNTIKLIDSVTQIAKENKLSHLWAQVWVPAGGSTQALKVALSFGGVVQLAQNDYIILTKEIGS